MTLDPMAYFINTDKQDLENKDLYLMNLLNADIYLYVEDKNCGGLYERLLKKIYPGYKTEVFDFYDGKSGIIKRYKKLEEAGKLTEQMYFLLDRDYENKFENRRYRTLSNCSFKELKNNEKFRIWKKTNIENYLLENKESIIEAFQAISSKKREKFEQILTDEMYLKIKKAFKDISLIYMMSHLFDGEFKKIPTHIKSPCCTFEKSYTAMLIDLERCVDEKKNGYVEEIEGVQGKTFNMILEEFRENFDEEFDIDGKQMLKWIIKFIKKESEKICQNGEKDCSSISESSIKGAMLLLLSEEQIAKIKEELQLL